MRTVGYVISAIATVVLSFASLPVAVAAQGMIETLYMSDRLDPDAPVITVFQPNTASVVAIVGFAGLVSGQNLTIKALDAGGIVVATYQHVISGQAGDVHRGILMARLIHSSASFPASLYRTEVSIDGQMSKSVAWTVRSIPTSVSSTGDVSAQLLNSPLAAVANTDARFGMANIFPDHTAVGGKEAQSSTRWMRLARDGGAVSNRLEFKWREIEARRGEFNYSAYDMVVKDNLDYGLVLTGILIDTPSWASITGGFGNQVPSNLYAPVFHADGSPNKDNYWGNFVYNTALRYKDAVLYWQIWNEPNLSRFWSATQAEYYQLLKVAYQAIKRADPKAKVILGGFSGYQDMRFLDGVLQVAKSDPAAKANNFYFDILSWHAYSRARQLFDGTNAYRDKLGAYGLYHPIWITESGIPAWDDHMVRGTDPRPYQWSATLDEQASYVIQSYAYALAASAGVVHYYRSSDTGEPEAWGMVRGDGSLRPAYIAYQVVTKYFQNVTRVILSHNMSGYDQVILERPGQRITALWASGPNPVEARVPASREQAILVDKFGQMAAIGARGDQYHLLLPPATANLGNSTDDYIIGGDPYLIVEDE
ncbi:MAG: cellulase family glycosylhydrolase [Chloroflexi bacterium]|nr:cellulase family glycosylhydrolase [Chloroflexota bacterium]MCL5076280.1 cellulase family glycosylhydrolase [Chloroflexota bacterium]